ncbi:uncharacterized protein BDV17DRAFT_301670 [Aspergillus undulatus]|uniref:uncharacterized protein n=1 Tax=Aspergillus undulatus TaxID=1810928 RepID=UPI003CCD3AA1
MRLTSPPLLGTFLAPALAATSTTIVPELSTAQWISDAEGFDSPKVSPINTITWDWWSFDAVQVSPNNEEKASFVATFYTAGVSGFEPLVIYANEGHTSIALAELVVIWHNGTRERVLIDGTEARIGTVGDGTSGVWDGLDGQASFLASPNMRYYQIALESEEVEGTVTLQSLAPPHYPCGPAEAGQDMQLAPHIGWANAVPDAASEVHLSVGGRRLDFTGIGYHDKNWVNSHFQPNVGTCYWGHSRAGPYNLVWFGYLPHKSQSHVTPQNCVSAYVARDGEILTAQCSGITVRPYGENATYPPLMNSDPPRGYKINVELPDGTELEFTATIRYNVAGAQSIGYLRWTGGFGAGS